MSNTIFFTKPIIHSSSAKYNAYFLCVLPQAWKQIFENCLFYVLLKSLTIWNSVIFRWWERSPKRGGTSHEISLNCACFVIFIYMYCTWRQSAYFVVSFRSPSEIILPWCLIISTKSPPFFLPILILKPKVSLTFILSPSISQRQTPDLALFTNIGINWALHTKKSFGSSSKKEKKEGILH